MTDNLENKAVENEMNKPAAEKPETKKKKKGRKKKILKRIIWLAVILLVLGIVCWSVYSRLMAEYKITYDPYTATTGSISNSLSFTGSMQLIDSATYTASSDTKVREIYVSEGDRVKDGDKLMRLNGGETIEAEFDGTVSSIIVEKGDEVKSGDTLMTVADFDHMVVSVRVGESNIAQVSAGQSCKVTVSSAGANFESVIDKIDYVSYTGNNVAYYTATVNVDTSAAENVWPGMQATVTVPLEEAQNVTVLKMDALSTARNNTAYVYKENENGEMEEVTVTVGVSNGNYVEIKEGVTSGETVYKIAEKEEETTGLAGLLSGLFTNRQVNRPGRSGSGGSGGGNMPDFSNMDFSNMPSGGFPGGSGGSSGGGFPGGGSRGN
ncbi:MAG: HlyD family efflux transporter periplasmic adaptor subunit [Clostridia bacterium]|nr:HlyD family efflux transporter periplasmic adaptor subunit [Clostridia bacterium]